MRRRSHEAGFTLVELLLAMSLMLVVMAATLTVFARMERGARDNQRLNDVQMQSRVAIDALAKRLRNLASPADNAAAGASDRQPLELAQPQDLVFRTVNSAGSATAANPQNVERYRYCLGPDGRLYVQRQTWTTTVKTRPTDTACPGAGWDVPAGSTQNYVVAAQHITNAARPVFLYEVSPSPGNYEEVSSVPDPSLFSAIGLRTRLFLDPDPVHPPQEATLTTRVFLRNQNRPPTAAFTATVSGHTITLNGSSSEDPENNPLLFQWLNAGAPLDASEQDPHSGAIRTLDAAPGTTYQLSLRVVDVGRLDARSATHTISCDTATPIFTCTS
jgi:prepilin-type N-terminal cleavage/methylation domain-containing protein